MDPNLFFPSDSILFVGEGNFSFSLSFRKQNENTLKRITATCYERENLSETTVANVKALENLGVKVFTGIDATQLTTYPELICQQITCIIFNFPHIGGKMKIDKNRRLLQEFFASCTSLLAKSTRNKGTPQRIMVSLCKGQGGTPADRDCLRAWGDTWQVVEMAALSGFVLKDVQSFCHKICPDYSSVGYRSREHWFHTDKALIHIFQASAPLLLCPNYSYTSALIDVNNTTDQHIVCERLYIEFAGFSETKFNKFEQLPRENALETYLFQNLLRYIFKSFEAIQFTCPSELCLHSITSESQIPCVLKNGTVSWLRESLFDVVKNLNVNIITYGAVFDAVTQDFSKPPAKHQALIISSETERLIEAVTLWSCDMLNIDMESFYICEKNHWSLTYMDKKILEKRENAVVIELSFIAMLKYKLDGFRDLLVAQSNVEGTCTIASLYPRTHMLDICFTEGPEFSENNFHIALWRSIGRWVIEVKLLDRYIPEKEDWVSRCYRIWYRSSREALSRSSAVNLHQNVLPEVLLSSKIALEVL